MAEHGALATLKDLAEKEVEDAARLLGEMRRGCQQAEELIRGDWQICIYMMY